MEFKKICILGLGYIGLPTACTFAASNQEVIGVDINPQIIQTLQNGGIHISEPGLWKLVKTAVHSGQLKVRRQPEKADAFIIAVPTPFYGDKKADLRAVCSAAESIVPYLEKGNLVILESTSPPGTTANIVRPILEKSGLTAGVDFHLAYSPERVLPGKILHELIHNDRVIGGITLSCARAGKELYSCIVKGEIITTDATTAEMVKLMENTFRDVNIAIANEFSRLADRFGIDVWEAISIANRHPRVNILNPGPGVGGHCISVDPWFLVEAAPDLTQLIKSARQVNDAQPHYVVDLVRKIAGNLAGKRIAALGLAYKSNVDDLRESPAVEICHLLAAEGALVTACEPYKPGYCVTGFRVTGDVSEAVQGADIVLLLVGHDEFIKLDPNRISNKYSSNIIIDTVGAIDQDLWNAAGYHIYRLGTAIKETEPVHA